MQSVSIVGEPTSGGRPVAHARRSPRAAIVPAALLLLGASAAPSAAQVPPGIQLPDPLVVESELHNFRVTTVADGLEGPWSIAFLPSGEMLVTEKPGRLRIVRGGALQPEAIAGTPEVRANGQGGLLDVVPHPDFESNRLLYLSYSKPSADGEQATTAVARARFDGTRLSDLEDIFVAEAWGGGGAHFGSRLAFHPDGHLFLTVGDRGANPLQGARDEHPAQRLDNHQGKVIRLHDDGRVPDDNPFVGRPGALPEIWSYGHRNLQGLVIDPESGAVWATEHGAQGGDELNQILRGRNYGWPVIGYGVQYGGARIHQSREQEGMEQPLQYWTPSIGPSGLMRYDGDAFPEWRGHLFVGGLSGQQIARVPVVEGDEGLQAGRLERPAVLWGIGRVRDIRQGPDGLVYVALDGSRDDTPSRIVRLEPAP